MGFKIDIIIYLICMVDRAMASVLSEVLINTMRNGSMRKLLFNHIRRLILAVMISILLSGVIFSRAKIGVYLTG